MMDIMELRILPRHELKWVPRDRIPAVIVNSF